MRFASVVLLVPLLLLHAGPSAAQNGEEEVPTILIEGGDRVVIAEYVLFGVGLAAVTTGVVLLVLDDDDDDDEPNAPGLSVGLAPTRGGTLLQLGGTISVALPAEIDDHRQ